MTAKVAGEVRTFPCTIALAPYLRVATDNTTGLKVAGAEDEDIGIVEQRVFAGNAAPVRLANAPGTVHVVAAAAIAAGAALYKAADGKVTSVAAGDRWGIAVTAASGNNSVFEALRSYKAAAGGGGT